MYKRQLSVNNQLDRRRKAGPTHQPDQMRRSTKQFGPAVRHMREQLHLNTAWKAALDPSEAESIHAELVATVEYYTLEAQRFQAADTALATARRSAGSLFSAEARAATAAVRKIISSVRGVLADGLEAGDPEAAAIREGCGVGTRINYESPVEVQRFGEQQLLVLGDQDNAVYLQAHGVRTAVFVAQLEAGLALLGKALEKGPGYGMQQLRAERDDHQLRLEILGNRILVAVYTVLGEARRDELRALLPRKRSTRKAAEVRPTTVPGGNAVPLALLSAGNPDIPVAARAGMAVEGDPKNGVSNGFGHA